MTKNDTMGVGEGKPGQSSIGRAGLKRKTPSRLPANKGYRPCPTCAQLYKDWCVETAIMRQKVIKKLRQELHPYAHPTNENTT